MREISIKNWEEMTLNVPTTWCKRNPKIVDEHIATKKHNEKAEWKNNMTRELERLEKGTKAEIYIDLLKTTLNIYQIGKRRAGFWFNKFTFIHDRLAL